MMLKVYLEYGNEVWNPLFPQHDYAVEQGMALELAAAGDEEAQQRFVWLGLGAEEFPAGLRFQAQRSVEVFGIFERFFGSRDRLVRVLSGWHLDTGGQVNIFDLFIFADSFGASVDSFGTGN